jgi:adenylate cyclase
MHILSRGDTLQKLRLGSGLILFVFATTHFLNTAIGLVSLEQMDDVDQWRRAIIRSLPGTIVLASALVIHMVLALWKLGNRSTLRLPPWEIVQILLGLLIPLLLFPHIVNTRYAHTVFGVNDNYLYELAKLWPASAILQSTLLLIVWIHGCLGLHFWLRLSEVYRSFQPALLFLAITIPLAALAGFMVSGRAVANLIADPGAFQSVKEVTRWPGPAESANIASYHPVVRLGFLAAVGVVGLVIALRHVIQRSNPKIKISYAGGPTVTVAKGPTLLEISRANGIGHASVCGGRARCSTCRVRIEAGGENLPPPVFPESVTLAAIEAPENIRLACQIRPTAPLTVTRLLRPVGAGPQDAGIVEADSSGTEKPLAVLSINMRGFSELSARKLPYDVVFLLNEFFATLATAIKGQGGTVDKFIGDGVIAVFGQKVGVETGCRQALRAIREIDLALDHLNSAIGAEVGRPVQIAAGLFAGPLILGRLGFGDSVDLTVIGDAVNVALELTEVAKEADVQAVVSADAAAMAGWPPSPDLVVQQEVQALGAAISVVEIARGRDLDVRILAEPTAARRAAPGNGRRAGA